MKRQYEMPATELIACDVESLLTPDTGIVNSGMDDDSMRGKKRGFDMWEDAPTPVGHDSDKGMDAFNLPVVNKKIWND